MSDLISRQAAIDVLRNRWLKTRNYDGIGEDIAEECEIYLKTLPSAQPVRHGKWDYVTVVDEGFWRCSNCGTPSEAIGAKKLYKYCPFCGARMDEQEAQNGR